MPRAKRTQSRNTPDYDALDRALEATFPASDPPSAVAPLHAGEPAAVPAKKDAAGTRSRRNR